jgi:uncharacterized protein (TIGR04255 family)
MAVVVQDATAVLETTVYEGYEKFRPIVELVVQTISDLLNPDGVNRVGLRYIDEIRIPSIDNSPGDWEGFIDPHLLAAVEPNFLPEGVTAQMWQGIVTYSTGDSQSLTLRYGPGNGYAVNPQADGAKRHNPVPPGPFFLLDSDSAWTASESVPEFSTATVMSIVDDLHRPVSAMFRAACTDRLRETFDRTEDDA